MLCVSSGFLRIWVNHFCRSSIEILPGGLKEWTSQGPGVSEEFPFVLVDGHLGIPQKVLYKLYVVAVTLYKNADQAIILALSSIILLANPAHQTALNARKRLITEGSLDPKKELDLIALFIGGSKDCAKQSIVWDHRRWIFGHYYERIGDDRIEMMVEPPGWRTSEEASFLPMIPLGVMGRECGLIRQACELYPRNYHAWTHYHWVMDVAAAIAARGLEHCEGTSHDYVDFVRGEMMQVREWIARHVSDYSAAHLLCGFAVLDRAGTLHLTESGSKGLLAEELREHALGLVQAYPSHETLWLYLRNVLSLSTPDISRDVVDRLHGREDIPTHAIEKYISSLF